MFENCKLFSFPYSPFICSFVLKLLVACYNKNSLISVILLLYSLLLFLFWFVFGDPAPGCQGDVDVEDGHNNYRKIESCNSCPKRHRRVRQELQKEGKNKSSTSSKNDWKHLAHL